MRSRRASISNTPEKPTDDPIRWLLTVSGRGWVLIQPLMVLPYTLSKRKRRSGRDPVRDDSIPYRRPEPTRAYSSPICQGVPLVLAHGPRAVRDRKSTRLNSSHDQISYAVFCLKKKKKYLNLYIFKKNKKKENKKK